MLTYEIYNKRSYAVRVVTKSGQLSTDIEGDRKMYSTVLKAVKARWNSRMKGGAGWLVNRDNVEGLDRIIESMKGSSTKSVKSQKKYRKEVSESEDSESETDSDSDRLINISDSKNDSDSDSDILLENNKVVNMKETPDVNNSDQKKDHTIEQVEKIPSVLSLIHI